jgi:N-acetylneuraminate synthase
VKFQAVFADEILHPNTGEVELPTGRVPLYERFRAVERDTRFYRRLKERCEEAGLAFLCTPFGLRSAAMLEEIGVQAYKIASPELNHLGLLRAVAAYGKQVLVSSGVSTLADIERALEIVGSTAVLLHCVTAYPAPPEDYNLNLIPNLSALLGVRVGVSDHSLDPVLVPALAASLGAACLEKHLTLSRATQGLDDPIALEPSSFRCMVEAVRTASRSARERTLESLGRTHGAERVRRVLGNGVKALASSESSSYGRTNRSVHARRAIARGEQFSEDNLAILRTERLLRPGVHPEMYERLLGRRATRDIESGQGITWEDF